VTDEQLAAKEALESLIADIQELTKIAETNTRRVYQGDPDQEIARAMEDTKPMQQFWRR
jgi:hypothetical protein